MTTNKPISYTVYGQFFSSVVQSPGQLFFYSSCSGRRAEEGGECANGERKVSAL